MGERKRRLFSPEFKQEAVRRVQEAGGVEPVARELGLRPDMLRDWKARARDSSAVAQSASPGPADTPARSGNREGDRYGELQNPEVRRLRHQLAKAREEVAFLRRVAMYFAGSQPIAFGTSAGLHPLGTRRREADGP